MYIPSCPASPSSPAAKRRTHLPTTVRIHNLLHSYVHARHADKRPRRQRRHVQARHRPACFQRLHPPLVHPRVVEPKGTRQAVGVPASEQTGRDADEIVEDGHADGEDEGGGVHEHDEADPDAPAEDGVAVQVPAGAEEADEEELGRGVRVQAAGDEEVGDRDPVRGFLPFEREGAEGWGGDGGAGIDVGDDGEDGVEGCGEDLEGIGGFHGVARVFHLRAFGGISEFRGFRSMGVYIRIKNMKCPGIDEISAVKTAQGRVYVDSPAYAKTGLVILMNADTKSVLMTMSMGTPAGLTPAPIIATTPATMMLITLNTLNQLSRSSVRGKENRSVGMAKMPV